MRLLSTSIYSKQSPKTNNVYFRWDANFRNVVTSVLQCPYGDYFEEHKTNHYFDSQYHYGQAPQNLILNYFLCLGEKLNQEFSFCLCLSPNFLLSILVCHESNCQICLFLSLINDASLSFLVTYFIYFCCSYFFATCATHLYYKSLWSMELHIIQSYSLADGDDMYDNYMLPFEREIERERELSN